MSFREERANERKLSIVKAAAKLFSQKGYHEATLADIARELKYTKGSIYYYIQSKQDLLFQCHEMAMNMLLERIERVKEENPYPPHALKEAIKAHIDTVIDEMNLITVALGQEYELADEYVQPIIARRDLYERHFREIIARGIREGYFKPLPPKLVTFIIFGACNWIVRWYSREGPLSKDEIAEFFASYLIEPLLTDASRENSQR